MEWRWSDDNLQYGENPQIQSGTSWLEDWNNCDADDTTGMATTRTSSNGLLDNSHFQIKRAYKEEVVCSLAGSSGNGDKIVSCVDHQQK